VAPQPGDYEQGSLKSRAAARARLDKLQIVRLIFSCPQEPLNLQTSRCHREIWPGDILFESVQLDGRLTDLTEEQLDQFIQRFPIETDRGRNTKAQLASQKLLQSPGDPVF